MVRQDAINRLARLIGPEAAAEVKRLAQKQDRLEAHWLGRLNGAFNRLNEQAARDLVEIGRVRQATIDALDEFFAVHAFAVARRAYGSTRTPSVKHLARPPKGVPKSLKDLIASWDYFKTRRRIPKRQKEIAKKVKAKYLERVQEMWRGFSEDFRRGEKTKVYTQQSVVEAIARATKKPLAESRMIVETETTYYYNQVRRQLYDASPDVTHYLFVAVRDHATTKWCRTRDHLVYEKGSLFLANETPPIHWNCRSELLPLNIRNPLHRKIINDLTRRRTNHSCEPLPKGWGRR